MTDLNIDNMGAETIASEKDARIQDLLTEMANIPQGTESRRYARHVLQADPGNPWAMFVLAGSAHTAAEEIAFLKEVVRHGKRKFGPDGYADLDLEGHSLGWIFALALGQLGEALDLVGDGQGAEACRELLDELVQRNPLLAMDPNPSSSWALN